MEPSVTPDDGVLGSLGFEWVCLTPYHYRGQELDSSAAEHGIVPYRCLLEQLLDPFIVK